MSHDNPSDQSSGHAPGDASLLAHIAEEEMRSRGFLPEMPPEALAEAAAAREPEHLPDGARDLRGVPFSSIDNPDSRDLDQIEWAERTADGGYRLLVGIADVDAYVPAGSAIDRFAAQNTTSVYTGVHTWPMLPERLSFDVTSLLPDRQRLAIVVETHIAHDGALGEAQFYSALVRNHGKLDYPSVSAWLDGRHGAPGVLAVDETLRAQVHLHDEISRLLYASRKREGALDVDTAELRAQVDESGKVTGIVPHVQDRAGRIIEELMVASNRATALALDRAGLPSLRRVVRRPERWPRIVAYAAERGVVLPAEPDSVALSRFADRMRAERTDEFAEISLALVKLIGRGEYAAHAAGAPEIGHFGLAATAYNHSTAPNRRYPDLIAQRLIKAMIAGRPSPISLDELAAIAAHCTEQGAAEDRVERRVQKSAAASLLASHVGQRYEGVITGAGPKGTFVRLLDLGVEGKLVRGEHGLGVGDKVRVKLLSASVEKGFIDFESLGKSER